MKQRLLRVNELIKRELGVIIRKDFEFNNALVTVNNASITPDLRQCHVYISVIGSEHETKRILKHLEKRRGFIQGKISKRVVLKNNPQLTFKLDDSSEDRIKIVKMLEDIEVPEEEIDDEIDENEQEEYELIEDSHKEKDLDNK